MPFKNTKRIFFKNNSKDSIYFKIEWQIWGQYEGDHLGLINPTNPEKILSAKIVHTSETFFNSCFPKNVQKYI